LVSSTFSSAILFLQYIENTDKFNDVDYSLLALPLATILPASQEGLPDAKANIYRNEERKAWVQFEKKHPLAVQCLEITPFVLSLSRIRKPEYIEVAAWKRFAAVLRLCLCGLPE